VAVGSAPSRLKRLARAALCDRRGAAAVEFAMVAAPFFFMIFAIIQLALYFMVQVTLDNAVAVAARQLRTGQIVAQSTSDTADKSTLMTLVCSNMSWLQGQCQGGASNGGSTQYLTIDVRPLGAYSSNSPTPSSSGGAATGTCFNSGGAGTPVEFRAFYRWKLVSPILMGNLQTFSSGVAELQSTEVFQIEPNGQTNSSSSC
jgi:Flp pilus assembly protein TadG